MNWTNICQWLCITVLYPPDNLMYYFTSVAYKNESKILQTTNECDLRDMLHVITSILFFPFRDQITNIFDFNSRLFLTPTNWKNICCTLIILQKNITFTYHPIFLIELTERDEAINSAETAAVRLLSSYEVK